MSYPQSGDGNSYKTRIQYTTDRVTHLYSVNTFDGKTAGRERVPPIPSQLCCWPSSVCVCECEGEGGTACTSTDAVIVACRSEDGAFFLHGVRGLFAAVLHMMIFTFSTTCVTCTRTYRDEHRDFRQMCAIRLAATSAKTVRVCTRGQSRSTLLNIGLDRCQALVINSAELPVAFSQISFYVCMCVYRN